uniref:Spliceosome-associated protein CWC27 homolog n=1 Tax=Salmo trutta TaxID=8032 RepID=A0A673Y0F2_SALTR
MSNIYIQEPPTNGKVLIKTSAGDIDIELWSKEAPKAARNFVQLCMEGYYDGTPFHRVVPEFIVQGGDPTGSGTGGESIYGRPFKDEFHSRLRFNRRGLVAMANAGPHDNGSQFFFTLGRADELNNKHTIFGKVTGDTVYNMLRLSEVECDQEERPLNPHKIRTTEVLHSPFDDIIPRERKKSKKDEDKKEGKKSQSKATNYEQSDSGPIYFVRNFSLLSFGEEAEEEEEMVTQVSQTLKGKSKSSHDLLKDDPLLSSVPAKKPGSEAVAEYLEGKKKYEDMRKQKLKKGSSREAQTMALLDRFKSKLSSAITETSEAPEEAPEELAEDDDKGWMAHVLQFDEQTRKVKDANMQDEDTFEISDPRNPVNKRRREESKKIMKEKKAKR